MTHYNLALLGFGGVNRALAQLIGERNSTLATELGFTLNIVAISDLYLGSVISANGLDARMLSSTKFGEGGFAQLSGGSADLRAEQIASAAPADILIEATFTNPTDGTPAVDYCRRALASGKHVATTNKGPVAFAAEELRALARAHGVRFEYEGSVMSGTPVLRMAGLMLAGSGLTGFQGILNGTSNFVLGRMEQGDSLDAAVAEAQRLGYAEADPTADIAGFDVRLKVVILANDLFGSALRPADVACKGIQDLTPADIEQAQVDGARWKLIGEARRSDDGSIVASVAPRKLDSSHPLAGISGATNAISFSTELLGDVTVRGPGAGRMETAYALLSDIIAIHRHMSGDSVRRAA